MIKLIPYNNRLISIGNENHYDGQLVYSDGNVAYGWHYVPQQINTAINRSTAGLWVCAEHLVDYGDSFWCLMDENLNFENVAIRGLPDPSENVYRGYCYPWVYVVWMDWTDYTQHGEMILDSNNHYSFIGNVIRVDNNGRMLTYYDEYDDILHEYTHYWLCSYDNDGSVVKTDLKPLSDQYDGFRNWYKISAGQQVTVSTIITALDTQGGYVTVETESQDEPYIHFYCANGVCTEASFPTQIILSDKAKLLLPSLDLIVNGVTYGNDILQLLDGRNYDGGGYTVNGVHAYKDIVISQFSADPYGYGYMFKNGTLYDHYSFRNWETGEGVLIHPYYCWSLSEIPGGQWYVDYNPFE